MDPAALEAMVAFYREHFANPGSVSHEAGRAVAERVEQSTDEIAQHLGATAEEVVLTSGATESNNLALMGVCLRPRQKRRKVVSVVTEHRAILDPLERLRKAGFEVKYAQVQSQSDSLPGLVDLNQLEELIDSDTALVSVMLANNEIGVIQPLAEIAKLCRANEVILHSDASQAVGRLPVSVDDLDVDLLSFSAHKFYGPKGVGGLFVRRRKRNVRIQSQIVGGGQQHNMRSGTLNAPGVVAMAHALSTCVASMPEDQARIQSLRNDLFAKLVEAIDAIELNGPTFDSGIRMPGNLNCRFMPLEGQSLMLAAHDVCVSSGSACTSAEPTPSHVLAAIGATEDQARSSLRIGVGRMNTQAEIDQAAIKLAEAYHSVRKLLS